MRPTLAFTAALCGAATLAHADLVQVEIRGSVEFNQIRNGELAKTIVPAGSLASIRFTLDSTVFQNDGTFPTRGYSIDPSSFVATFGSVSVGLANPFPLGTPLFVLRDNDPAVDGFFLSDNTGFPGSLPTTSPGFFGPFGANFSVGYTGDTLSSLNILDAVGTYTYDGLTNFNWTTDDGGNDAMGMVFEDMTISTVPAPASLAVLGAAALLRRRR